MNPITFKKRSTSADRRCKTVTISNISTQSFRTCITARTPPGHRGSRWPGHFWFPGHPKKMAGKSTCWDAIAILKNDIKTIDHHFSGIFLSSNFGVHTHFTCGTNGWRSTASLCCTDSRNRDDRDTTAKVIKALLVANRRLCVQLLCCDFEFDVRNQ